MKPSRKSLLFLIIIALALSACSGLKTAPGSGTGTGTPPGTGTGTPPGTGTGSPTGPFTIGGTVLGLKGTGLVLQDNGGDDLAVTGSATVPFTFKTTIATGGTYNVIIKTQPSSPTQTCSVTSGTGTATANVTNIQVVCAPVFNIGGSISGLLGTGLTLQDNGGDNLVVTGTGNVSFTFATPLLSGATYAVTILTQPKAPVQTCSVVNGSGTVSGNVSNVNIICSQPGFSIGGSVVGLVQGPGATLELQNNAGDNLLVTGDTTFTFPTPVTNGGLYNVTVFLPPTSQPQKCTPWNWTGIATGNVSNVVIDCQHNDWNWISWYATTTNTANNYATVTTPLKIVGSLPVPSLGAPGGRDFAITWTDKVGRKWLFGGLGYPYPSIKTTAIPEHLLNDLWVFDPTAPPFGAWQPANLPMFQNTTGDWLVDPRPLEVQDVPGVYGTLGTASGGAPGSRWGGSTWTDSAGNLWMFGGQGFDSTKSQNSALLNDIWEWVPGGYDTHPNGDIAGTFTGQWVWQSGFSIGNQSGIYGTQGVAAAGCATGTTTGCVVPGGRWAAATATDPAGNVWLFGGQGYDSAGKVGLLNDLWQYNPTTKQWTWIGPSNSNVANQNGSYGTLGTGSGTTAPGGRQHGVLWADAFGNIWLFGGFGFDSAGTGSPLGAVLNDLWKFNTTTKQWVWMSGGGTTGIANQAGTYGTQTTAAAGNIPGSRWGAVGWVNPDGDLFFFGGWGYGASTTQGTGFLNDIWEYDHTSGQWTWWKGSSGVNQQGAYVSIAGVPFVNNVVGARRGAALWQPDPNGYVWVFGGEGYDSTAGAAPGYLDDLWTYLAFP
jgi:Galactose oxidase, central domain